MSTRYFNLISTREYAELHGISVRAAQRAVAKIDGAVKSTGNRWVIPIPSTQYAKLKGISADKARRIGVKGDSADAVTSGVKGTLKQRAAQHYYQLLIQGSTNKPPDFARIEQRLAHARRTQLIHIEALTTQPDLFDDEWLGDDNLSVLFYH